MINDSISSAAEYKLRTDNPTHDEIYCHNRHGDMVWPDDMGLEPSGLGNNLYRLTVSPISSGHIMSVVAVYLPVQYDASFFRS